MNEQIYEAEEQAKLYLHISSTSEGVVLQFRGFSDKLGELINVVVDKISEWELAFELFRYLKVVCINKRPIDNNLLVQNFYQLF